MEKVKRRKWVVLTVAALFVAGLLPLHLAGADSSPRTNDVTVSVDAPAEVMEGTSFVATMNISAVENFDSYDYYLDYDPDVIEVTDVTAGMLDSTEVPLDGWGYIPPGTPGSIRVIGNVPGLPGVNGTGYLSQVHFDVIGSACNSSVLDLHDGTLNDKDLVVINATWEDGSVHVSPAPAQNVTVTMNAPAEVTEGTSFIGRVDISAVEDFDSCDFRVTYDPSVVEVTDVTDGLIDGTAVPVDSWGFIPSGVQGTLLVIGNIPDVDGASGEGYLAEIHFDVVGTACNTTDLNLHDGTLNDTLAQEIAATWIDDSVHVSEVTEEITFSCPCFPEGWNYMSLPLIPLDDDIDTVLASIEGDYDQIWAYVDGEWEVYVPGQPDEYYIITGLTKLETIDDGLGYAVKMTDTGCLTGSGVEIEIGAIVPPTYPINESWNLIGFKTMDFNGDGQITQADDTMKARHYLRTMNQDADDEIIGDEVWYLRFYDPAGGQFHELHDSHNMLVCRGFWLYARVPGEISPPIEPEL